MILILIGEGSLNGRILPSLISNWCNIPSYDPAFNSIPAVGINIISDRNNIPVFDEVDKVGDDKAGVEFYG